MKNALIKFHRKDMNILKKLATRAIGLVLSITMILSCAAVPASALYRGVLGDVYSAHSRQIGAGIDLTLYSSVTDGLNERAYVFEYRPDEGALPIVSYGEKLIGSRRTSSLAEYEKSIGNNVIGGVNGDFYSFYTGIPMGAVIRDGRILSDDDNKNAVGFTDDGEVIFGKPMIDFSVVHIYKDPEYSGEPDDTQAVHDDIADSMDLQGDDSDKDNTYDNDFADNDEENADADGTGIIDDIISDELDEESADVTSLSDHVNEDVESGEYDTVILSESATEVISSETSLDDYGEGYIREALPVSYFNKYPTQWGAYMLDDAYSSSTKSTEASLELTITLDSANMFASAGATLTGTITSIESGTTDSQISHGTLVISVCEKSSYRPSYDNVKVGDRIEISFSVADGWENVTTAIGGSDLIIENGVVNTAAADEYHEKYANPRTAVGIREDNTVVFFAVDGRSDDSYGMRLVSLAETMLSLGCVQAMNLDGGGSTTVVAKTEFDGELTIVNTPSDSAERAVSNALLLIDNRESDNIPRYVIPNDTEPVVLPGETYKFDGKFYDRTLNAISLADDAEPLPEVKLSFDRSRLSYYDDVSLPNLGTISEDGLTYTADGITGEIPLLFTAEYMGETITGRVILFVANAPDTVDIALDSVIYAGSDGFDVEFNAYYMGKPVPAKPEQLTFTLSDDEIRTAHTQEPASDETILASCSIGRITEDGRFVPYDDADGSAWLTIALDGIPMSQSLIICGSPYITLAENTDKVYDFTSTDDDSEISVTSSLPIENAQSLDLYANDTDLSLYASVSTLDGSVHNIRYEKCENEPIVNGIVHYRAELNDAYLSLETALYAKYDENVGLSGELKIEKIRASFDDTETIFGDTFGHWARQSINALYELGIVGGEEYGGEIRFAPDRTLSRAEFAVMISRSLDYDTSEYTDDMSYADIADIPAWALDYVKAVSANGIMNGKDMPDGTLCFDPYGKITRQEIMQVIGNIVKKIEKDEMLSAMESEQRTESTDDSEIPPGEFESIQSDLSVSEFEILEKFADSADVAEWARENTIITLSAGIVNGYEDNTVRPTRNVTRAESAAVILRTLNYLNGIEM